MQCMEWVGGGGRGRGQRRGLPFSCHGRGGLVETCICANVVVCGLSTSVKAIPSNVTFCLSPSAFLFFFSCPADFECPSFTLQLLPSHSHNYKYASLPISLFSVHNHCPVFPLFLQKKKHFQAPVLSIYMSFLHPTNY